jgi:hypothetical protein
MNLKIRFGVVVWFDMDVNKGKVKVEGEPVEADFSLDTQRPLVEGLYTPEFNYGDPPVAELLNPYCGLEVACVVAVNQELRVESNRRTLRRTVKVSAWAPLKSYREVEQAIAARPVYEAVQCTLYNEKPTSAENQREVINYGTPQALQSVYPRGVQNDPLAPERKVMDLTYRVRFYRLMPNGKKVQCPDPRPRPVWMPDESFQPTNEQGELLATREEVLRLVPLRNGEREFVLV